MPPAVPGVQQRAKTLGDPDVRRARLAMVREPHIAPLNRFVEEVRAERGCGGAVPWLDPLDGGVDARVLFVLEAPGPKAVASGFVSRDNPDESAKNWLLANYEAGLDRRLTAIWNAVPWYIGAGGAIRSATSADIAHALPYLVRLLALLPAVEVVALVGKKAQCVRGAVERAGGPSVVLMHVPHPSPPFVNRRPENRGQLVEALRAVRAALRAPAARTE
jgi:uracil-DNA glycosylase